MVGIDGLPVDIDDLPIDGVLTVFPEGAVGSADSQTLLIHVADELLQLPPEPHGLGAGGLRRVLEDLHPRRLPGRALPGRRAHADLPVPPVDLRRPRPARRRPSAPPRAAARSCRSSCSRDGTFVALGDFPEPVGPSFWNMTELTTGRDDPAPATERPTELERVVALARQRTGRRGRHPRRDCARSSRTTGRSCSARSRCSAS